MGALTEESSTDEVIEPCPSEAQEAIFVSSQQEDEDQGTSGRSHPEVSRNEMGLSQSRSSTQRHVIKNTDEIFQTMDQLMKKLHRLRVNTHTHSSVHIQITFFCSYLMFNKKLFYFPPHRRSKPNITDL